MTATCRRCLLGYEPTAYEMRNRDFMCRPCRYIKDRAYRERRKAEGKPVSGARMPSEYHKAYDDQYAKRPEVRARRAELARLRTRDPNHRPKINCRRLTRQAVESGRLVRQPCELCGATSTEAHHEDYAKPLDVRWLCRLHHREHHAQAKALGQ